MKFCSFVEMKKLLALFTLTLFLSSCGMIYFDRIPGKPIDEFPENFRGDFLCFEVSKKGKQDNIDSSGKFSIKAKSWIQNNGAIKEVSLSDEVKISSHGDFYFLSIQAEHSEQKYWNTYILEKKEQGFVVYPVVAPNGSGRKQMRILKKNFSEVKLLDKGQKKDDFWVKMNEEQLVNYFQKKLKKFNYYRFTPSK